MALMQLPVFGEHPADTPTLTGAAMTYLKDTPPAFVSVNHGQAQDMSDDLASQWREDARQAMRKESVTEP